ncbi:MAG: nitroreductase family protein [Halanaerobiales bacterium]|nr:nitroreductase family protein [Halanaerobiales bacterium]
MIIAVAAKKDEDCVIKDREYFLFDAGLSTSMLILRATELGLVAHPIAGYSPSKAKEVLNIPKQYKLITLINIGKHSKQVKDVLSEKQIKDEKRRPKRKDHKEFIFHNVFNNSL